MHGIQEGLDTIPKRRHKKLYTKEVAKWVKEEYSEQLKNLTMSEGKILVKLIYRETKTTSYQIVKSYRGRFNAFFWQTMAKFWDNNLKTEYDPVNVREDMLIESTKLIPKVKVKIFNSLLVDFAKENNSKTIIRGLRAFSDYEYEFKMSLMNRSLDDNIVTLFMMPHEKYTHVSSSLIKEVASLGGDMSKYVPSYVESALREKFGK
mgnify:CR=1 FL=1